MTGTANEIDVDGSDATNPIVSLSSTIDAPGTFTIQGTVALDSVIDDDTMATASATNVATSESVKAYVDSVGVTYKLVLRSQEQARLWLYRVVTS